MLKKYRRLLPPSTCSTSERWQAQTLRAKVPLTATRRLTLIYSLVRIVFLLPLSGNRMPGLSVNDGAIHDECERRQLFGGAITVQAPLRFQDVSAVLEVPDNQEMLLDGDRDESITVEILKHVGDVQDNGSARWFLEDLAADQGTVLTGVTVNTKNLSAERVPYVHPECPKSLAIGTMYVSKSRQGEEANNLVRCYVANLRMRQLDTDILIIMWEPLHISPNSSSAPVLGAGPTVPAATMGCMPAAEVFDKVLSTFEILKWELLGS